MRIGAQKRRELCEIDAFVGELLRLVPRRLPANRTRRCLVVMDLARFLGKAPADIFGIANDFAQFCDHLARQPCDGVVTRGALGVGRLRGRGTFAACAFGDTDLRRRESVDVDVIADGTNDERRGLLPIEFFGRGEPPFEAMAVRASEVKNDHDEKTGTACARLTPATILY
jgi:hypothetical protein